MNYIIRQIPDSRPATTITPQDPDGFTWPAGETVEVFTDEAAFEQRLAELNAPFDQEEQDEAAAEEAWRTAIRDALVDGDTAKAGRLLAGEDPDHPGRAARRPPDAG